MSRSTWGAKTPNTVHNPDTPTNDFFYLLLLLSAEAGCLKILSWLNIYICLQSISTQNHCSNVFVILNKEMYDIIKMLSLLIRINLISNKQNIFRKRLI